MSNTADTARPKLMGISDEVSTCECCGRPNLKRTVMISLDGESDPVYFGSQCAHRALTGRGYSIKGSEIMKQAEALHSTQRLLSAARAQLARYQEMANAGYARYVIGGNPIGAELSRLIPEELREISMREKQVAALQESLAR